MCKLPSHGPELTNINMKKKPLTLNVKYRQHGTKL